MEEVEESMVSLTLLNYLILINHSYLIRLLGFWPHRFGHEADEADRMPR